MPLVAVRADFAAIFYESEAHLYTTEFGPEEVMWLTTHKSSYQFTAGPQFQWPEGPVQFYTAPMLGVYNYRTVVEIDGNLDERTVTTKFGWSFSGGMLVRVYDHPGEKFNLGIDLGAKYHIVKDFFEREIGEVVKRADADGISLHGGVLFNF